MNVASLELCKELYELSGWNEPHWSLDFTTYPDCPAYNLGYLLRKLPNYTPTYGDDGDDYLLSLKPNFEGNEWEAAYWGIQKALHWNVADTPEDAVCKLAIELHKQGLLPANSEPSESKPNNGLGKQ